MGVLLLVLGGPLRTVGGAATLGLVVTALFAVHGPRTAPGGVRVGRVPEGLVLPRRPGHVPALALLAVLAGVAALCIGGAAVLEGDASSRAGAGIFYAVAAVLVGGWLLLAGALGRGRMLLTRDALVYRALLTRTRIYPWADVRRVRGDRRAGGTLTFADDRHPPLAAGGQGVDPERLAAVLDHLARSRPRRDVLFAPDGPEVVAGWLTGERPLPRR